MNGQLLITFQITVIGMGLVFAALSLLWLVMAILLRFAGKSPASEDPLQNEELIRDQRKKAAAIAVCLALSIKRGETGPGEFPLPPTAVVSAWQNTMRTSALNKRGSKR